ncbi:MAG: hypothetical protein JWP69_524 [Flaviaesturariibacter sp.]|nr:hypothetical protein [Flaviaesturariibacter sp.]
MKYIVTATLFLLLTAMSCKKNKVAEDQLPPITQTGANTFGCLINGNVYIAKGYNGTGTPNPKIQFDIGLNGLPYLSIDAKQLNKEHISEGQVFVAIANISGTGTYTYPSSFNFSVGWNKYIANCGMLAFDTTIKQWGEANITKYDLTNHIISGTFNFKYKTQTCDTIRVTDGRFDFKF